MTAAVDLHLHTTASDGSLTPAQLLALLIRQGVHTFAVTDHDAIHGATEIRSLVPEGMRFIPGVEFSCASEAGKYHILGYGYDPADPLLAAAIEEGCQLRRDKLTQRIRYLREAHGIHLTPEETAWLYAQKSPGKPHLGQLLLRRGLGDGESGMLDVLNRYISPFKGGNDRIPLDTAIRAIRHAGGVAVWAHPLGGEGKRHKTPEQLAPLLSDLLGAGIQGMECWYSRYSPEEIDFLRSLAQAHGLLISGGSDFHGSPKPDIVPGMLSSREYAPDAKELTVLRAVQADR